jgi:hypothetical protein
MEIEGYYAHTSCALSDLIESAATIALWLSLSLPF